MCAGPAGRSVDRGRSGSDESRCVGRACLAAAARARHRRRVRHVCSRSRTSPATARTSSATRSAIAAMLHATGHCAETGVGAGRQPDGVRRSPHAGRHSHDRLLRALRWPAARPEGMDLATIRTGPAQSGVGKRGPSHPASICGNAVRPGVAPLCPVGCGRQGTDHRADGSARRDSRGGTANEIQHQVRVRGRGGGGLRSTWREPWRRTRNCFRATSG